MKYARETRDGAQGKQIKSHLWSLKKGNKRKQTNKKASSSDLTEPTGMPRPPTRMHRRGHHVLRSSGNGSPMTAELSARKCSNPSSQQASDWLHNLKRPGPPWKCRKKAGGLPYHQVGHVRGHLQERPWTLSYFVSKGSDLWLRNHSCKGILHFLKWWWFTSVLDTLEMSQICLRVGIFTDLTDLLGLWKWWHFL